MNLRPVISYQVQPNCKWANISAVLMGIALFLRAFYYFYLSDFAAVSAGEIVLSLMLMIVVSLAWICSIRIVPMQQSRIYGIIAASVYVILGIAGFFSGNVLIAVLGLLWYLIAAAACVLVSFGYLPYRIAIFAAGFLPATLSAIVTLGSYIIPGRYLQGVMSYATVLILLSLSMFAAMLKPENA